MTLSHEAIQAAGTGPGRVQKTLRRGPIEIAYTAEGAGSTLLLVPSLGRGAEDFDAIVPLLVAAGLRTLCPEPRGIGGSLPLAVGDTLHDMAADLAALVEHEGAGPILVVGHAAGNWTARVLAHDRPDLVRGVALLAAVIADDTSPDMKRSITASFDTSLTDAERLHHLERAYFAPGHDATPWLSGWYTTVARAQRQAASATTDRGWRRSADRIPTLYVAARQDRISPPPTLAELCDLVGPKATLAVVEGAGHALLPEQPAAVAEHLIRWSATLD